MTLGRLISIFILIVNSASAAATTYTVKCPEKIQIAQEATTVTNWQTFVSKPNYYVNGVTFYSGKPEEEASLKPNTATTSQAAWTFSSNDQIYLACEYNQTNIQYYKLLPLTTTRCVVQYAAYTRGASGSLLPKKIQCYLKSN